MAIDRRIFLTGIATYGLCLGQAQAATRHDTQILATGQDAQGHLVAGLNIHGKLLFTERLPDRGHGLTVSPDGTQAAVFARRPGRWVAFIGLAERRITTTITAPNGRHFYGHGTYSLDGQYLYATENDFDHERGMIAVHEACAPHRRVTEFLSGGIGPHELILLRDNTTLAVANGGILTHPDYPRQKLNLSTMTPNLTYIDARTGIVSNTATLPPHLHQLSTRHIAEGSNGTVWWGAQYEGPKSDIVPLVGFHKSDTAELQPLQNQEQVFTGLDRYVGSIAVSGDKSQVAVTSPRGNKAIVWDTFSHDLLSIVNLQDVCGLGAGNHSFIASSGEGHMTDLRTLLMNSKSIAWDNHLTVV